jgi:hypothetical protein
MGAVILAGKIEVIGENLSQLKQENCGSTFRSIVQRYHMCIALFEACQGLPSCPSDKSHVKMKMNVEDWGILPSAKIEIFAEKPVPVSFIHNKSHMDWHEIETGHPR